MANESKDIEALRNKIQTYLRQKNLSYEVKPNGSLWIRQGSTLLIVDALMWNERTLVRLTAPVALNISKITPELTRFLLEKNHQLLFGKFSLDPEEKAVLYEHVLLGDDLDVEELFVAVATIALAADQNDEQVAKMAGGKRVADL